MNIRPGDMIESGRHKGLLVVISTFAKGAIACRRTRSGLRSKSEVVVFWRDVKSNQRSLMNLI